MLNIGDTAPDFALEDQSGTTVTLDQLVKHGDVVLYFYPADFSPVCSAQARAFSDDYGTVADVGVQVVGVSPQSSASHQRFAALLGIPFPLLSDPRKQVIRAYGVDGLMGLGVRRATFLINGAKIIENRVLSDLFVVSHRDLLKAAVEDRRNDPQV